MNENNTQQTLKVSIDKSVWKIIIDTTTQLFETKCVTEIAVSEFLKNLKLKIKNQPFENEKLFGILDVQAAYEAFEILKAKGDPSFKILYASPSVFFVLLTMVVAYHKYLNLGFSNNDQAEIAYNTRCFLDALSNEVSRNNGDLFRSKELFTEVLLLVRKAFDRDLVLFIDAILLVEYSEIPEFTVACSKTSYLATLFMMGVYNKENLKRERNSAGKRKNKKYRRPGSRLRLLWTKTKNFFKDLVDKSKRFF